MRRGLNGQFEAVRCEHCGDVIGVYEPMVVRGGEDARETSLAAEPGLPVPSSQCYHRACFAALKHRGES